MIPGENYSAFWDHYFSYNPDVELEGRSHVDEGHSLAEALERKLNYQLENLSSEYSLVREKLLNNTEFKPRRISFKNQGNLTLSEVAKIESILDKHGDFNLIIGGSPSQNLGDLFRDLNRTGLMTFPQNYLNSTISEKQIYLGDIKSCLNYNRS